MSLNVKCPGCGSNKVQLTNEKRSHGCFWLIMIGVYYIYWVLFKWIIGIFVFFFYDWWVAIIKACLKKRHIWLSKRFFTGRYRTYYCHNCGNNFRV